MNTISLYSPRSLLLAASTAGLAVALHAQTTLPELENYIEVGGGAAWVDGDAAAFQARHGLARKGFGGITDFYLTQAGGKFIAEGHAIAANNDYLIKLLFTPSDKFTFKINYKEFRTWSNGKNGFVPYAELFGGATSLNYFNPFFALDRTEFSAEALYKPVESFELRLKFTRTERDGQKDSTSQGDTNLTYIPQVAGTSNGPTRSMVPSFYEIDESRNIVEGEATYRADSTTLNAGLRWESSKTDDARVERRRPFEAADRYVTQREENDTDLFSVRGSMLQRLNDRLTLSGSYIYTKLDADIGGSRIYGATADAAFDPVYPRRQARDEGFYHLESVANIRQHVGQLAAMYSPSEALHFVGSLRLERERREAIDEFIETNVATSPAGAPAVGVHGEAESTRHWDDATGSFEARYTGLAQWVFVARAEGSQGDGALDEEFENIFRDSEYHRWTERYGVTANWYPSSKANVSFMYGYKDRTNDNDGISDSTSNIPPSADRYPAYIKRQNFRTDDFGVRVTLRPLPGLTTVTRLDLQNSDITSFEVGLGSANSAVLHSQIVSQSLSWSPLPRLYLQGTFNWVLDKISTPAKSATGAATGIVLDSINDYWNGSLSIGYAADDSTDVLLTYEVGKVDNWFDNSRFTVPYGIKSDENVLQLSVARRINRNLRVTVKYAFADYEEPSANGLNDYTAHVLLTQVQYRF